RPMRTTPAQPDVGELRTGHALRGRYQSGSELQEVARRFGAAALDRRLLEALAWASYIVGMELPGLRSLLAGLSLDLDDEGPAAADRQALAEHTLVVSDHDRRTGQLAIDGILAAASGEGRTLV